MSNTKIILRLRSPDGTKRLEVDKNEKIPDFMKKLRKEFDLEETAKFHVFADQNKKIEVNSKKSSIAGFNIKHGDMLYIDIGRHKDASHDIQYSDQKSQRNPVLEPNSNESKVIQDIPAQPIYRDLKEDEIDVILSSQSGRIERGQDAKYCHHPKNSKCIHCTPLEPYDEEYLNNHDPPIKYMSFHSYLRKLMSGADKGKLVVLDSGCCSIKPGCKEHKPWPKGICTKCQPSAVTLQGQTYRHVDNIMFENAFMVERFLNFWRKTGYQRVAYLFGHYETHKDVPLGIKAVVSALYEPPQVNTAHSVKFLEDPLESTVDWLAGQLGMKRIGWIFTDLEPEKKVTDNKDKTPTTGLVKCLRNKDTYFMSAAECIIAAHFQNKYPNVCRTAPQNVFGSKFVTVVVTGDQNNAIHFEGYQVTQQCMTLVKDDCLVPTIDAPELGFVRESTNTKYVPDVFYKAKDSYGNEILHVARPLPVEYLIIDIPASCPVDQRFTFANDSSKEPFPIENRVNYLDENQTFYTFAHYLKQYGSGKQEKMMMQCLNDFHVLLYLTNMEVLPMRDSMEPLLRAIHTNDEDLFQRWCFSDNWQTLQKLVEMEAPPTSSHHGTFDDGSKKPPPPRHLFGMGSAGQGSSTSAVTRPFHEEFHFSSQQASAGSREALIPNILQNFLSAQGILGQRSASSPSSGTFHDHGERVQDLEDDDDDVVEIPAPQAIHWTCSHCTFVNERCTQECEVCGLPPP